MLFVCLAHFANSYQFTSGADDSGGYLVRIGMLASPTFVTVSGLVAGFLSVTRSSSFTHLRYRLIDRGAFLLIVGHAVLASTGIFTGRGFASAYRIGYITDVIAIAVILGPWLVDAVATRTRLMIAAAVFAVSWSAVFLWQPTSGAAATLKHYLIGAPNPADWSRGDFPVVPWFAVYLVGTTLGERIGQYYLGQQQRAAHLFLVRMGVSSIAIAFVVKAIATVLARVAPAFTQQNPGIGYFLSSYQKFPPGIAYVTLFAGAGLLLVAGVLEAGQRQLAPWLLNELRQLGSASLFVYVLQFYMYAVIIHALHLPYTRLWPIFFVASVYLLARLAAVWNKRNGNRLLTVGLAPLIEWASLRRTAPLAKPISVDATVS